MLDNKRSSLAVKAWRKRTKQRIIESMGGKCCICGYNKCNESLSLHHLDPSGKEISMGSIRATPRAWAKIIEELRKCVLVCNNCHGEIHYNNLKIPDNVKNFDESFSTYEMYVKTENIGLIDKCEVCGKDKPAYLRTCSNKCSAKLASKTKRIKWELYDLKGLIKIKSYNKIAQEIGCSVSSLKRKIKRMNLNSGIA